VRHARAGCVVYTGIAANGAAGLMRALARVLPRAKLFGSDGIAESSFTDPRRGGVPARVGRRVTITTNTLAPRAYPPSGQDVFRRYAARYADPDPDSYAIYGYEAMRLVLDAVAAAGPDRAAVLTWLHSVNQRASVLGTYRFDRFGDTTLRMFGVYGIRAGRLSYERAVEVPTPPPPPTG
jgi:branched-chain amino acid transport system substrate-binding protein